ncbi:hypothetical protein N9V83_00010 [Flavobacteriales bacterium]|nr:hypothetical protein [Flavobacteriales bacterium]
MNLIKVKYKYLNSKQQENYNFHKIASGLAEFGFNSIRLTDDYQGADFIAIHIDGEQLLKVQLKGRLTIDKKYLQKEIYIAFIEDGVMKLYDHDFIVSKLKTNILQSKSWSEKGIYHWGKTPSYYEKFITKL